MKRIFALVILIVIAIPLFQSRGGLVFAQTTYYVSSSTGNDANNGTSPATAWGSVFRIHYTKYNPGDAILLKRGDIFGGQILDTLQGSPALPIIIGAYGSGAKPIIYGDLRDRTWIKMAGRTGYYKAGLGGYTQILQNFYQYVGGTWIRGLDVSYRGSNPVTWEAFYDSLGAGEMGFSVDRDTIFIHTFGSVTFPGTRDSLRIYHYANRIMTGSHDYVVRDLDIRNFTIGLQAYGDHPLIRNISTRNNPGGGLTFQDNVTYGLMDSCVVDSSGDTGIYLVQSHKSIVRYNTVKNVLATLDGGIPSAGVDLCGVGILDNWAYGRVQDTIGYNIIEYNTFDNIYNGFTDWYFDIGDTVRYNTGHRARSGGSPHGTNLLMTYNNFTFSNPSGGNGANIDQLGNGNITYSYNTLDSVKDFGVWVSGNAGSGTVTVNNNNISVTNNGGTFVDYKTTPRITSTKNNFYGNGRYWKNGVYYSTLSAFHDATGYEKGSSPLVALTTVKVINFGEQKRNQSKDTTAAITNDGGDTLKITNITSTNNLFSTKQTQKNVAFAELFNDTLRFTPSSFGNFSGNIIISSNDPLGPDTIKVTGTSPFPIFSADQSSINYGEVIRFISKPLKLKISNSSINTLIIDSLYTKTSLFSLNKTNLSIISGDSVTIPFTPVNFGAFTDTLFLKNNSTTTMIKIPLLGISPYPKLLRNPASIDFGDVARKSSKKITVKFTNSSINTLLIDSIYSKTSVFSVSKIKDTVTTTDSIVITFAPQVVNSYTDTLYLKNNTDTALVKIPISGNCPPSIIVSSASGIFFPDRAVNDSVAFTVYARNISLNPLFVSDIRTTNSAFIATPNSVVVAGLDSAPVRIVFKPKLFGALLDTLTVTSDGGIVTIPLHAASPFPVMTFNKQAINYGLVVMNDSVYQEIVIKNTSINKLKIDSMYTKNSVFNISFQSATITDSLKSLVLCFSKKPGVLNDTLYLKNNSANTFVKVPISVKVYSRPGRPDSSRISPDKWTNASSFTIDWKIPQTGMLSTPRVWYSLDTVPSLSSALFNQLITGNNFTVTMNTIGKHTVYFFLEDSIGNKNRDSTSFVIAKFDNDAPTIIHDNTKLDTIFIQADGSINTVPAITASASEPSTESGVKSMKLIYRKVGDTNTTHLNFSGTMNSSITLPATIFKSDGKVVGIGYQIEADDSAGNSTLSNIFSFDMRFAPGIIVTNSVEVPSATTFPVNQMVKAYRIFSLPYEIENKKPSGFMEQSFGSHSEDGKPYIRWRMERLIDSNWSDYESFKDSPIMNPGSAFFIITRDPGKTIAISNAKVVRVDKMSTDGIQLNKGWNLVGNPFLVNIPFNQLSFTGGKHLAHYYYSGTGPQGGWESSGANVDTLRAWQGWALKMDSASVMKITPSNSSFLKTGLNNNEVSDNTEHSNEWSVRIDAKRSDIDMAYLGAEIGMSARSLPGYDDNDQFSAPFIGKQNIGIYFTNESGALMKDIRSVNEEGDCWNMTVRTGDGNAKAALTFSIPAAISRQNFEECLLDVSKGLAYDLKQQHSIEIVTGSNGLRTYSLLVGTRDFVVKNLHGIELLPNDPRLYLNYPNPFNPTTTIRYAVPNKENHLRVDLKVFNIMGQEIQTLVREDQTPGFYEVYFDGSRYASGIYFYRINITGGGTNFSSTKKMVLIK